MKLIEINELEYQNLGIMVPDGAELLGVYASDGGDIIQNLKIDDKTLTQDSLYNDFLEFQKDEDAQKDLDMKVIDVMQKEIENVKFTFVSTQKFSGGDLYTLFIGYKQNEQLCEFIITTKNCVDFEKDELIGLVLKKI